jgi:hypothetical protein
MTQADRVLSTPPTNTPKDTTRRRLLTIAAAGSIAGFSPAIASAAVAASADPIFAAIECHRDLAKACDEAWKLRARCKDFGTLTEAEKAQVLKLNDAVDEAHLPLEEAAMNLFNTAPTTHAGIIAAFFYMRIQHRNGGEHMIQGWLEDEDGERYIDWRDAWLETLIHAVLHLDDGAVQS